MIACVCARAEAGDPAYLDAAVEIPWVEIRVPDRCAEAGPHHHACTRPVGHTGRHLERELLGGAVGLELVTVAMAVWDD